MKKTVSLALIFVLLLTLCVPGFAAEPQLDNVTDAVGLLSDEQWYALESDARRISEAYQCGVYIVVLDDFTEYVDTTSVRDAAETIYLEYSLGLGGEQSGVMLLLSLSDRDYALIAYGYGNTAFTDYGKDRLAEEFLDNFGNDDWVGGFQDYLAKSESMLRSAREGKALDVKTASDNVFLSVLCALILGALAAFLVCRMLSSSMRSVFNKAEANAYIRGGQVDFTLRQDLFTHKTESRVKIEKQSKGGTSVNSRGFSGKSGKF